MPLLPRSLHSTAGSIISNRFVLIISCFQGFIRCHFKASRKSRHIFDVMPVAAAAVAAAAVAELAETAAAVAKLAETAGGDVLDLQ